MEEESTDEYLSQIGDGVIIALGSIIVGTILGLSLSYIVIYLASPVLYGLFSILVGISPIVVRLFQGIDSGLSRTIPRLDVQGQNAVITTSFMLFVGGNIVVVASLILGHGVLFDYTALNASHETAILAFATFLPLMSVLKLSEAIFRSHKQIRLANIVWTVSNPVSKILGVSVGVFFIGKTLFGVWIGISIVTAGLVVIAVGLLYRYTDFSVTSPLSHVSECKEFLVYVRDSTFGMFAAVVQYQGAFILMILLLQPVEAGLFSLGVIIVGVIRWPLSSINQIFPPIMSELYEADKISELNKMYKQTTRLLLFTCLPLISFIILFNTQILTFFSESYASNVVILPILAIGQFVAVVIGSVGLLLMMTDHQREAMWLEIGIDIIFVPIGVWVSFEYGLIGLCITFSGILIINNILELSLLNWKTGLFPFTYLHGKIFLLAIGVFAPVALIGMYSVVVSGILFIVALVGYIVVSYNFLLQKPEKTILIEITNTIKNSGSKDT